MREWFVEGFGDVEKVLKVVTGEVRGINEAENKNHNGNLTNLDEQKKHKTLDKISIRRGSFHL